MTFVERCQAFAAKHHKISPTLLYVTFFVMLGFVYPTLIYAAEVTTSPHSATSTEFARQPRLSPQQILFGTGTPMYGAGQNEREDRKYNFATPTIEKIIQYRTARIQRLTTALGLIEKQAKSLRTELEDLQYASPSSTEALDLNDFNAKIASLVLALKKTNFNLELNKLKVELKNESMKRVAEEKRESLKQEAERTRETAKQDQEHKNELLKRENEARRELLKKQQELLEKQREMGGLAPTSSEPGTTVQ